MTASNWDAEAEAMALHVAAHAPITPVGAIAGREARVSVVFGNDPNLRRPNNRTRSPACRKRSRRQEFASSASARI